MKDVPCNRRHQAQGAFLVSDCILRKPSPRRYSTGPDSDAP